MIDEKIISKARELAKYADLNLAFEIVCQKLPKDSDRSTELDVLMSRFSNIENQRRMGIVSFENYTLTKNQITSDFLEFLNIVNKPKEEKPKPIVTDEVIIKVNPASPKEIRIKNKSHDKKIKYIALLIGLSIFTYLLWIYNTDCERLYKAGNFEKAKNCLESKLDLDYLNKSYLLNCDYILKGDNFFMNTNFPNALQNYLLVKDTFALKHREEQIKVCQYLIKANQYYNTRSYQKAKETLKELERDIEINPETKSFIDNQINDINRILEKEPNETNCEKNISCFYSYERGGIVPLVSLNQSFQQIKIELNRKMLRKECEPYFLYELEMNNGIKQNGKLPRDRFRFNLPFEVIGNIKSGSIKRVKFTVECDNHNVHKEFKFEK